jgi:hypothetical protein
MLHPALSRALATAHMEDLQREAACGRAIRIARGVLEERQLEEPSIEGRLELVSHRPRARTDAPSC